MKVFVVDIECKGLLPLLNGPEDFHVASLAYLSGDKWDHYSIHDPHRLVNFFENPEHIIIGHNFYMFDIPAIEKMLGIKCRATIIDTLFLSWYLEPNRKAHGLEAWGEYFGIPKPEITDWENLSIEEYTHRCEEDVKINIKVWEYLREKLSDIYQDHRQEENLIRFLMIKAKVYYSQQNNPFTLDQELCNSEIERLEAEANKRIEVLQGAMPSVKEKSKMNPPKKPFLKSGGLSSVGQKWFGLLKELNLPDDHNEPIEFYNGKEKEPNPNSTSQVKDWLFSLGWEPIIYETTTLKSGDTNEVPQIKDKEKNLCKSVLKLAEKVPAVAEYKDLGIIQHRLGLFKGFLRDMSEDGTINADISGLTNTLRIRHRKLVNLPKPGQPWAENLRACLLPPKGRVMIGSDLSSLESVTRNNFVLPHDPEFVNRQSDEHYDPHLDIGVTSGMLTEGLAWFYKLQKKANKDGLAGYYMVDVAEDIAEMASEAFTQAEVQADLTMAELFEQVDDVRANCKTVNYSSLYGVGAHKLSKTIGCTVDEAKSMLDAYWEINWAVKTVAAETKTQMINKELWLWNPIAKIWYSLRSEKDIFSTLNQGTGDFIHTLWMHFLLNRMVVIHGNFHDEIVASAPPDEVEEVKETLTYSIGRVNEYLKLELPVGIDYKTGENYADVH